MRKVPKPFDIVFDPARQPGHSTRSVSLDRFTGGASFNPPRIVLDKKVGQAEDLRQKFKSQQVAQLLPSALAKRGSK